MSHVSSLTWLTYSVPMTSTWDTNDALYEYSTLCDTKLIGLEVPDLARSIIESVSQSYKGNWVSIENHPLSIL